MNRRILLPVLLLTVLICFYGSAWCEEGDSEQGKQVVSVEMFTLNNLWMMVAAFLVFIMHLGFATLEAGLTRAKNTVNILFKNTLKAFLHHLDEVGMPD